MAPLRNSIRWLSSRVRSRIVGTSLDGRSGSDWSLSWRMTDHWRLVNLSIELVLTVLQGLKNHLSLPNRWPNESLLCLCSPTPLLDSRPELRARGSAHVP